NHKLKPLPIFRYVAVHLRALHSFPTRRSSDLRFQLDLLAIDRLELFFELVPRKQRLLVTIELDAPLIAGHHGLEEVTRAAVDLRSEEHTSELQSRFDLVCRLLLEKKKASVSDQ